MNTDCRQLLSWKGRVNHMPKLQAQRALCNLLLLYICRFSLPKMISTNLSKRQALVGPCQGVICKPSLAPIFPMETFKDYTFILYWLFIHLSVVHFRHQSSVMLLIEPPHCETMYLKVWHICKHSRSPSGLWHWYCASFRTQNLLV